MEVCSGEYIVRIDADDINFIDRLERVNSLLEESDNMTKMVFSDFEYIDSRDNKFSRHKKASNIKSIYYKNPIPHPTVVINREFLLELSSNFALPLTIKKLIVYTILKCLSCQ